MVAFLQEYFSSVHWFSLVIYEPNFRSEFESMRNGYIKPARRPFLLLLSVVLGLGAWYRGQRSHLQEDPPPAESRDWSQKLIANAESQIMEILDQSSVTAVQTLTLLGSFFVYHGRPNLSFSLLGATVKSAHAAGLHKRSANISFSEDEERKRVWWTIYTWDRYALLARKHYLILTGHLRFASITYGRPISIDENDCSVGMPKDVDENVDFQGTAAAKKVLICFSTYQRELNKLYMIASPAIKQVYSARENVGPEQTQKYIALLEEVTIRLWHWHQDLPNRLSLDLSQDCPITLAPAPRAHYLQSLSLQLTFDSLLIILHRPFLKRQLSVLQCHGLGGDHGLGVSGLRASETREGVTSSRSSSEGVVVPAGDNSQQQWWKAASRSARTAQLPQLAQVACDGHLAPFLAINLFNAAIVMIVLALSDPLADAAQEAKRAVARIYRLQGILGSRSTLSKQSIGVLRNLVVLLSRRESEAMLTISTMENLQVGTEGRLDFSTIVRDTVALPLGDSAVRTQDNESSTGHQPAHYTSRIDDGLASVQRGTQIVFPGRPKTDIAKQSPFNRHPMCDPTMRAVTDSRHSPRSLTTS